MSWTSTRKWPQVQLMTSKTVSPTSCVMALVTSSLVSRTACGQRDAPLALHGRADRCRRIHLVSLPGRAEQVREGASYLRGQAWAIPTRLLTLVVLVARQMLLQVADEDIGQVTDF